MDRNSNEFQHLKNNFGLKKTETDIKEGVFVGSEIGELMFDNEFKRKLNQQHAKNFISDFVSLAVSAINMGEDLNEILK